MLHPTQQSAFRKMLAEPPVRTITIGAVLPVMARYDESIKARMEPGGTFTEKATPGMMSRTVPVVPFLFRKILALSGPKNVLFSMATWIDEVASRLPENRSADEEPVCGTSACLAGSAVMVAIGHGHPVRSCQTKPEIDWTFEHQEHWPLAVCMASSSPEDRLDIIPYEEAGAIILAAAGYFLPDHPTFYSETDVVLDWMKLQENTEYGPHYAEIQAILDVQGQA